jgi:hypothetical protein
MTYDLVALESEVRDTEDMLGDLDRWERIWLTFEELLRKIVDACKGEETIYGKSSEVSSWITAADKVRGELRARRSRALGSYICPALGVFLDTSLRANEGGRFLDLIMTTVQYDAPLGPESFEQRIISPVRLDVELDACNSVIGERPSHSKSS